MTPAVAIKPRASRRAAKTGFRTCSRRVASRKTCRRGCEESYATFELVLSIHTLSDRSRLVALANKRPRECAVPAEPAGNGRESARNAANVRRVSIRCEIAPATRRDQASRITAAQMGPAAMVAPPWPSAFDLIQLTRASHELGLHFDAIAGVCMQFIRSHDSVQATFALAQIVRLRTLTRLDSVNAPRAIRLDGAAVVFQKHATGCGCISRLKVVF